MFWVINFVCCFFLVSSTVLGGDEILNADYALSEAEISTPRSNQESVVIKRKTVNTTHPPKKKLTLSTSIEEIFFPSNSNSQEEASDTSRRSHRIPPRKREKRKNTPPTKEPAPYEKSRSAPTEKRIIFFKTAHSSNSIESSCSSITTEASITSNSDITRSSDNCERGEPKEKKYYESIMEAASKYEDAEFHQFFSWDKFQQLINSTTLEDVQGRVLYYIINKQTKLQEKLENNNTVNKHKEIEAQILNETVWDLFHKKLLFSKFNEFYKRAKGEKNAQKHKEENSLKYRLLKTYIDPEFDIDAKIDNGQTLFDIAKAYSTRPVIFALSDEIYWLLLNKKTLFITNINILQKLDIAKKYVSNPIVTAEKFYSLPEKENENLEPEIYWRVIDDEVLSREQGRKLTQEEIIKIYSKNKFEKIIEYHPEQLVTTIQKAIADKSINQQDEKGRTLSHYLLAEGFESAQSYIAQEIFLSGKPNLNIKDNDGNTPLHLMAFIAGGSLPFKLKLPHTRLTIFEAYLKYAIQNGYDFSSRNNDGLTLLHLFARSETRAYSPIIILLKQAKECNVCLDLDVLSSSGASALYYSIEKGWLDDTLALFNAGANPSAGFDDKMPIKFIDLKIESLRKLSKDKTELDNWRKMKNILQMAANKRKNNKRSFSLSVIPKPNKN